MGAFGVEDLTSNGELDSFPPRLWSECACRWAFRAPRFQGALENQEIVSDLNFGGASRYSVY